MDRRTDLTMFAGFHVAQLVIKGGIMPALTFDEIEEMTGEYMEKIQPRSRDEKELQFTFELRHEADMRAIRRWQEAHPGKDNVWPDHADMVVWLLEQLDQR